MHVEHSVGTLFELFISKCSERVGAIQQHPFISHAKHNALSADARSSRVICYSSESRASDTAQQKSQSNHMGWPVYLRRYVKESKVEDYVVRAVV